MRSGGAIAAAVMTAATAMAFAAQPPQRPTFKAGVDLVPVDVSVVDRTGKPIADLGAADFSVSVDGRARKVVSAQFVAVPPATAAATGATAFYSSNEGLAGGRLIVLAIDAGNIRSAGVRGTLDAASRFVGTLNPADRIALFTLPGGGPQVDFTSNHALVQAALPKVVGQLPASGGSRTLGISEAIALD